MKRGGDARLFDCHHPTWVMQFSFQWYLFPKWNFFCFLYSKDKNKVKGNGLWYVNVLYFFSVSHLHVFCCLWLETPSGRESPEKSTSFFKALRIPGIFILGEYKNSFAVSIGQWHMCQTRGKGWLKVLWNTYGKNWVDGAILGIFSNSAITFESNTPLHQ